MQEIQPQTEHHWLQKLVGDWTFEHECVMGPGQPPVKLAGSETVRSLGCLWVLCEGQGATPGGGTAFSVMTLGFDPAKKRFVGTFIASVMTHLWPYDGSLEGNILTLDSEGPSFAGDGTMAKYQDIIEFVSDDHRTLSSQVLDGAGNWNRFMTSHYHRKK